MSAGAKIALLSSGFCLIVMAGARYILGAWHPLLYGFLAFFVLGLAVSVLLDYKLYLEVLSVKTAKKGLSLGWSLLILILLLTAVSYLGHRFNRVFDFTEEGIHSLSEPTAKALNNLDSDLVFYIFYKGDKMAGDVRTSKQQLKSDLGLYRQTSSKVKFVFIDAYKSPAKAEEYLSDLPDKNQQLFVFAVYKGRKIRVDFPFMEESLTSAIIKAQKREFKEIFFLTGHGEKSLSDDQPDGLKILSQSLSDSGFVPKEWNFLQKEGPPQKPPALVVSIGPQKPFLDAEKAWLKSYLSQGGNVMLCLDPKDRHQLSAWLRHYGLIFKNDFIVSRLSGLFYGSAVKALGVSFDRERPITKSLSEKRQPVLFEKASSWDISASAFEKFKFSYLIKSHRQSFSAPQLKEKMEVKNQGALTMAVEAQPKTASSKDSADKGQPSKKEGFRLVVFGDSDFLANRYIYDGANRDLALNSFISLAGEEELISIPPKKLKGTKITLHRQHKMILVMAYITLPLLFLFMGLWLWHRRRDA